jgi:membrane protease YdiL (CAAX protease family)
LFLAVSATWSVVATHIGLNIEPQQMLVNLLDAPVHERWILVLYGALGAPLIEELLFRGFLLPPLTRAVGVSASVVLSGVLFGLAHLSDPDAIVPLVVLGIGLGWLRIRAGSIWPGVVIHAVNNTIALTASLLGAPF